MNYAFADTGTYNVRFIASTSTSSVFDTILKTITIYPKINKNFLGKDTTYSQGSIINKTLKSPQPSHCQVWQDSSGLSTYTATKKGIYTCKVTNNAFCEVMDTIEIKECLNLTQPSIYHSNKGDTLFCNHIIADTFIWFKNDVVYKTTTTNNTNESFIKLTDTGTYRVEAIKYNHCNRSSSNFRINKLSINNLTLQNFNIKVYPNPSEGLIWIESDNSFKLQIIDILGKEIKSLDSPKMLTLPLGFYFFKFQIGEVVVTEKVVVL